MTVADLCLILDVIIAFAPLVVKVIEVRNKQDTQAGPALTRRSQAY